MPPRFAAPGIGWKDTAISMVDLVFQPPIVERVEKLLKLGYKINYSTWPFTFNVGLPLPSTQVWEHDFGGTRLEIEFGLDSTLLLLDEVIAELQAAAPQIINSEKTCSCSITDLFKRGCRC